jgi:hypothetical protein
MSQPLRAEANRARHGAAIVSRASVDLPALDPGAHAFATDAPGRLGELGARLRGFVTEALDARAGEAAAQAGRLEALADDLERAAANYQEADASSMRRLGS